jgi:hypothetical protein
MIQTAGPFPTPPVARVRWARACRLVASRYPSVGIFDDLVDPQDLEALIELEAWTNDRVSTELGVLHLLPRDEWIVGEPMASVVMAAFCHPRTGGGRFSSELRGAWYAARTVDTALAESVYHRTRELAEVGHFETRVQMRVYHSDIASTFHDLRDAQGYAPIYDPDSYTLSQQFARGLFDQGSHGIVYDSVRHPGGECLACFRPRLVKRVRVAAHYEYIWSGAPEPRVHRITSP